MSNFEQQMSEVLDALLEQSKIDQKTDYTKALNFLSTTSFTEGELLDYFKNKDNYNSFEKPEISMILGILFSLSIINPDDDHNILSFQMDAAEAFSNLHQLHYDKYDLAYDIITTKFHDFINTFICEKEGITASSDKTRTVMDAVLIYLQTGVHIDFERNYESQRGKDWTKDFTEEDFKRRPYWSPESFNNTEEVIEIYLKYRKQMHILQKEIIKQL